MDLELKGRTAVITGATRGIGRAIAELFVAEGASVAICGRDGDSVALAVGRLREQGGKVFGAALDVADGAALSDFIDNAAAALGGIDIFVANASTLAEGNSEEQWRRAFESDVLGTVRAAAIAGPYLEAAAARHGDAAFIAISSLAATEVGTASAYSGMKAALTNLIKGLARDFAPKKVRFNSVSPGMIYAEDGSLAQMRIDKPDYFAAMQGLIPIGRMGAPEEIAATVAFLASCRSGFIAGANIVVDGAMSTRVNF